MFPDAPYSGLPLSGMVVVECTVFQQGPCCGMFLADFGADVIKVEGPDSPDPGRGVGAGPDEPSPFFASMNRNKRSICLDLKKPEGREILLELIETADVFLQNLRGGALEKLGLGYEEMKARNPRIIYASGSGYGRFGPHKDWPSMDLLGQARGGTMTTQGLPDWPPTPAFAGVADQAGGLYLAYGIMAALWDRARTGLGQQVDASLMGGQIALQIANVTTTLFNGSMPPRRPREEGSPFYNFYRCSDGRWIALGGSQTGRWWDVLFQILGRPDIAADDRLRAHPGKPDLMAEVVGILDGIFATRPQAEWVELIGTGGFPIAAVQDYSQLADDVQVIANAYVVPYPHPSGRPYRVVAPGVQLSRTPGSVRTAAPEFGQHTEEILLERGHDWEEIARLGEAGVIGLR